MPGRDLMVRIRADVTDFQNKLRAAKAGVAQFDQNIQKSTTKSGKALNALGLTYRGVGIAAVTSVAAIGGAMIKSAADFDQGMSNVKATGADAVKNIDKLREAALKAGADTKYSATEAAGGVEALAKAGVTSADILRGGLSGALDLAAAGNLDVAGSAEAAASAMNQFGLKGKDVPHIADLLAAAAGKAQGEVSDMAQALGQSGLVANTFGLTIEETTGVLAEFAASGLTGSDAGTSLKTMLIRLAAPTDVARAALKKYHITTRDANGELKNAAGIAGELQKAFKNVDDAERDAALSTIFGQDAIRGASILYKDGAPKAQEWADAVDDAGFAAETAKTKMDNLKGDIETLKGSLDTLLIKGGGGSQGPLRQFVQGADDLTNGLLKAQKALDGLGVKPLSKSGNPGGIFQDLLETGRIRPAINVPFKVAFKITQGGTAKQLADVAKKAGLSAREMKIALKITGTAPKDIKAVTDQMKRAERIDMLKGLNYKGKGLKDALADLEKLDEAAKKPKKPKVTVDTKGATKPLSQLQKSMNDFAKGPTKKPTLSVNDKSTKILDTIVADHQKLNGLRTESTHTTHYETTGTPPGGFTGGRIADLPGYFSGRVPGTPPSNPRHDNVLAVDERGRGLRVRSREFIVNEPASRLNDRLLRAINSGADFSRWPGYASGGVVGGGPVASSSGGGDLRVVSGTVTINGLESQIRLVAQDAVAGNNFHRASRARANNG